MRILMAVSADGFVARGPMDDMKWTGRDDKAVFRLLTHLPGDPMINEPLLAGRRTAELMPPLKGRRVMAVSTNQELGISLPLATELYPTAWLIGGQNLALAALETDVVTDVILVHSPAKLDHGIPLDQRLRGFGELADSVQLGCVTVETRRRPGPPVQQGPYDYVTLSGRGVA